MKSPRERKHRLPRDAYRGEVAVSLTACVDGRVTPFAEADVVRAFIDKLADAAVKNRCDVLVYCFMPDHVHLLFRGRDDSADVWRAMAAFKQQTGYWFSRQRPEFSWQKDFHDHIIRSHEDLGEHARYIADNPVRYGLVRDWRDYPYTGAIGVVLDEVLAGVAYSIRRRC